MKKESKKSKIVYEVTPDLDKIDEVSRIEFREEIEQYSIVSAKSRALKIKYKNALEELEKYSNLEEEFRKRLFPSIYFSISYHHTSREPFIVGRTMWRKGLNDFVQISAYIGPLENFKRGIEDDAVKKIALDKIRKKIKEKYPL